MRPDALGPQPGRFADTRIEEPTVDQFINRLVEVFAEVRRVLRDDGVRWLNIGDAYTSGDRKYRAPDKKNPVRAMSCRPDTPEGL